MRVLVIVLVLLAAAKVGTQEYLIASAKSEIIIAAYRDRAVDACRDAARIKRLDLSATAIAARDIRLIIGKESLDVALWQVDHAMWQTRYKSPYLLFALTEKPRRLFCEFDIARGSAAVVHM